MQSSGAGDGRDLPTAVVLESNIAAGEGARAFDAHISKPMLTHLDLHIKETRVDQAVQAVLKQPQFLFFSLLVNLGVSVEAVRKEAMYWGCYLFTSEAVPVETLRQPAFVMRIHPFHNHPLLPEALDALKERTARGPVPFCVKCSKRLWGTQDDSHSQGIVWRCCKCSNSLVCSSCSDKDWMALFEHLQRCQMAEGGWPGERSRVASLYFHDLRRRTDEWAKKAKLSGARADELFACASTCLNLLLLKILRTSSQFVPSRTQDELENMIARADGCLRAQSMGAFAGLPYVTECGSTWMDIAFSLLRDLSSRITQ
jgi:hypothetical protein